MDTLTHEESILEKDFRTALSQEEIRSYFQPIVDIESKRIVGFESLARWYHSVKGEISPEVFIPLAEKLGLADDLSGLLFEDACRSAVRYRIVF